MERIWWVGLGGLLGSIGRYLLGGALNRLREGAVFPYETLVINVLGCLLIGVLAGLGETKGVFGPAARAFLLIGLLGGFTTFSTFGYETFQLLRAGQLGAAVASTLLQVTLGLGAVWSGDRLVRLWWGS